MVKTIFLCRRREGLTPDRYAELLLQGHVPLALRHHPTMRRYVVNVVERSLGDAPPLDSVGELWFDSLDDFHHRLYDSPEGRRIIVRDVAGFMGGADAYAATEQVHREPPRPPKSGEPTPGVKLVVALGRKPGLDRAGFTRHWHERHVPLVLEDPRVRGYATSVVDGALDGHPPPLDGVAELWFASEADLAEHAGFGGPLGEALREDLGRFLGDVRPWIVREYVER